jgi:hypothetical protein
MSINPIRTAQEVSTSYLRYLLTTFLINDPELTKQFKEQLEKVDRFVKGPILEATPPFQIGKTVEDLINEGVLSKRFRNLSGGYFPLDRPLYKHQERAILNMIIGGRNIVIATGTGSGKTEAFLIPILNHLFREAEKNSLSPGVRALLLYPMNALANDQLKRLRKLLTPCHEITFGRYTGETEEHQHKAEQLFRKNYPKEPRIPNELLSREQMREKPPHLLLTNYAMLEYLLLRPKDCEFFDGEKAVHWRFIVVDEAHTYNGAKGIEMSMLLQRLKDRIVQNQRGRLKCIGTSATLGEERSDFSRVAHFAGQLFGETFEWDEKDPARQDIVGSAREAFPDFASVWGNPNPGLYKALHTEVMNPGRKSLDRFIEISAQYNVPKAVIDHAEKVSKFSENPYQRFLYEILQGDANLQKLRENLGEKPQFIKALSKIIFPGLEEGEAYETILGLVDLSAQAKPNVESLSLLPARYHLFVRALEGAYLCLAPSPQLFLERRETVGHSGYKYPVFEMATCRRCGAIYLVGEEKNSMLRQSASISEENLDNARFYLLQMGEIQAEAPDDEDEVVAEGEEYTKKGERYILCALCGAIQREGSLFNLCSCEEQPDSRWKLIKVHSQDRQINHCSACRVWSPGLVRRFLMGQDAPVSVLTTSLYQQIPPKAPPTFQNEVDKQAKNEWAPQIGLSQDAVVQGIPRGSQMLLFSDSRQDAAFFACYLDRTYSQILRRRLIIRTLEHHASEVQTNHWRIQDIAEPLRREAEALAIFPQSYSRQEQANEVWKWLLLELMAFDRRNSLEGLGCVGFTLAKPINWSPPRPLLNKPWDLTPDEIWCLYKILLDGFRFQGALVFPDNIPPTDEAFIPRNREYYFRENGSTPQRHIFSWGSSGKGRLNRRLYFI